MVRNGTRRCDLCESEILGHCGTDICLVCRICMEDDPGYAETEALAEAEGFSLTAVVGQSDFTHGLLAANDGDAARLPAHRHHVPEGMVRKFTQGLRSISRRRWL